MAPQAEIYIAKVGSGRDCDPNPDLIAQVDKTHTKYVYPNADILTRL
jgi:hypothetical protein